MIRSLCVLFFASFLFVMPAAADDELPFSAQCADLSNMFVDHTGFDSLCEKQLFAIGFTRNEARQWAEIIQNTYEECEIENDLRACEKHANTLKNPLSMRDALFGTDSKPPVSYPPFTARQQEILEVYTRQITRPVAPSTKPNPPTVPKGKSKQT